MEYYRIPLTNSSVIRVNVLSVTLSCASINSVETRMYPYETGMLLLSNILGYSGINQASWPPN